MALPLVIYLIVIASFLLPLQSSVTQDSQGGQASGTGASSPAPFALRGMEIQDACVADDVRIFAEIEALGAFTSPLMSSLIRPKREIAAMA